ncbi:MAG: hypothetical protein ACRD30_08050, partial [Bryobacteraceae bacterium]
SIIGVMRKAMLVAAAILVAACSLNIQNADAVKQGVIDYLRARSAQTGLDVNTMQLDVTSVSFGKDQARATIYFKPKDGQGGMQMDYTLDRKGNKWVVRGHAENSANPHGSQMQFQELPPGHPPTSPAMPPGNDADSGAGALPQGHPPVGSEK